MSTNPRRDRLRELLDAVLDGESRDLQDMAGSAHSSAYHFAREVRRATGEPPVSLRRRVMLERAAWRLRGGASVTETAFEAGYESVEGFARAFARAWGRPPSSVRGDPTGPAWLPATNGIHFHPPTNLWVTTTRQETTGMDVLLHQVHHDLADTRTLLEHATRLDDAAYHRHHLPDHQVLAFDGPERSVAEVLVRLVHTKQVWLAAIEGLDLPAVPEDDRERLVDLWEAVAPWWASVVEGIHARGGWGDVLVDALCEPPESFVLGGVLSHVLSFSALRRGLVRAMLRAEGVDAGSGDPLEWLREVSA